jgi:signal peptidase II
MREGPQSMQVETGAGGTERPLPVPQRQLEPRWSVLLVLTLASVLIVSDQLTKAWITPRYGPCGNPVFTPVIGDYAGFSYVCNTGTAFSRFRDSPIVWLPVLIAACSVAWLWYRSLPAGHLLQQIAFGMIIGGAIGNMIDRARLGYVVDFVDLRLNDDLRFYVFNVADSSIVIGVGLLALAFWRYETGTGTRSEDPAPTPADKASHPHTEAHRGG